MEQRQLKGLDEMPEHYSWNKPKRKNENLFIQIALGLFFGLITTWFAVEKYYEYQAKKALEALNQQAEAFNRDMQRQAQQIQIQQKITMARNQERLAIMQEQQRLNNTWIDMKNGGFINAGRVERKGDITTVVIRNDDGEKELEINCGQRSFYSQDLRTWYQPRNPNSITGKAINLACK